MVRKFGDREEAARLHRIHCDECGETFQHFSKVAWNDPMQRRNVEEPEDAPAHVHTPDCFDC